MLYEKRTIASAIIAIVNSSRKIVECGCAIDFIPILTNLTSHNWYKVIPRSTRGITFYATFIGSP